MLTAPSPSLASWERLSPREDCERIDASLGEFLDRCRRQDAGNSWLRSYDEQIRRFLLSGGKRVRPRLCLAAYRVLADRFGPPDESTIRAASLLELLHAFMLVHDDLIDGSTSRRDQPCLHEALRGRAGAKSGRDLALLAGDLLFAFGMRQLARAGLRGATLRRALWLLSGMLIETGVGEVLDVMADSRPLSALEGPQVRALYLRKTARYTVTGPLLLGAVLAGAGPDARRTLRRYGDQLGFGYQIGNDLEVLGQDVDAGELADLDAGKRTYLLWTTHRRLDAPGRAELESTLLMRPGPGKRRALLGLIGKSGAAEACRARIRRAREAAQAALLGPGLDDEQRAQFASLSGLFSTGVPPCPGINGHHK